MTVRPEVASAPVPTRTSMMANGTFTLGEVGVSLPPQAETVAATQQHNGKTKQSGHGHSVG